VLLLLLCFMCYRLGRSVYLETYAQERERKYTRSSAVAEKARVTIRSVILVDRLTLTLTRTTSVLL